MLNVSRDSYFAKESLCLDFRITQVGMQGFVCYCPVEVLIDGRVEFAGSAFRESLKLVVFEGTVFPCRGKDVVSVPQVEYIVCVFLDR